MVSDMAGSNSAPGKGTGIPGPLLSLMKELSALPCIRDKKIGGREFHTWVSGLFNGTLLAKRDAGGKITEPVRFDLRMETGILHEAGRQFIPVIINECLVRGIYFMRRFYIAVKNTEIHSVSDLENIDPSELLPFNKQNNPQNDYSSVRNIYGNRCCGRRCPRHYEKPGSSSPDSCRFCSPDQYRGSGAFSCSL